MPFNRRDFLKTAGLHAGVLLMRPTVGAAEAPAIVRATPHVVVIGAGAFGGWTALYLRERGAKVTLVDAYGPGNSRSTSGDETRGVRTSYGDRGDNSALWVKWASQAIKRWKEWDAEWAKPLQRRLFFTTGDIILRPDWDNWLRETRRLWDENRIAYEVLTADEVRRRWPQIRLNDAIQLGIYERDAGVVRARRACESVAEVFMRKGGTVITAHASLGGASGRRLDGVNLQPGEALRADAYVFACGPWLPKVFPEIMRERMRTPIGHVFYFGTPPGDARFTHPNLPSWNVPGVTGWPSLDNDARGFRVRGGGGRPPSDPDTSVRFIDARYHEGARNILRQWFPALARAPLLETRACHYESCVSRNFVVDRHPDYDNVWIAGAGNAEGFKFGPVMGEYIAKRVLGEKTDAAIDAAFRIPEETYDPSLPDAVRAGLRS